MIRTRDPLDGSCVIESNGAAPFALPWGDTVYAADCVALSR